MSERPFKLISWHVRDFKTIEVRDVEVDGHHVLIEGPNASGKTSCLDTIIFALKGLEKDQPNPVRFGAKEAEVEITISNGMEGEDLTIRRRIDKDGKMKLEVERGGEKCKDAKQGVINLLLTKYMLNPVDFLSLRPQDQKDALLALCNTPPPVEEVEKITGVRTAPKEGENSYLYLTRLSGDREGIYYDARKIATHEATVADNALEEARATKGAMTPVAHPGDPEDWDSQLDSLHRKNDAYTKASLAMQLADAERSVANQRMAEARLQMVAEAERVSKMRRELEAAEARHLAACEVHRIKIGLAALSDTAFALATQAAAEAPNVSDQILAKNAERKKLLAQLDQYNAWKVAVDRVTTLAVKRKEAEVRKEKADDILTKLRDLRKKAVTGIDIGVAGLECDDEGLVIEGAPLRAASMAQQLGVACGIAIAQNPKLRLVRVDEGERLDHRSRMKLYDIADQKDCQVILTSVNDQDDLTVSIVE